MRLTTFACLLAALALPSDGDAQYLALQPGERVRILALGISRLPLDGTLMMPIGDTVYMAIPVRGKRPDHAGAMQLHAIPADAIQWLDHWTRRSRGAGGSRGLMVATAVILSLTTACVAEGGDYVGLCAAIPLLLGPPAWLVGGITGRLIGAPGWKRVTR